jgi:hypothetical protein
MVRARWLAILTAGGLLAGAGGCGGQPGATAPAVTPRIVNGVPVGWKTYAPPEGDFSVAAPGEPTVAGPKREGEQSVRTYVFRKGDATLSVLAFEREGKATQRDRPAAIRADPAVIPRSLREVEQGGLRGLEFLYNDAHDGGCLVRVYRWEDGKRAVTLRITKPEALPSYETVAFMDSFKLKKKSPPPEPGAAAAAKPAGGPH